MDIIDVPEEQVLLKMSEGDASPVFSSGNVFKIKAVR